MSVIVDRYSEEQFSLPVELKNAPLNGIEIFPSKYNLFSSEQDLKDISPEDFSLGVAYDRLNGNINKATIEVFNSPENVQNMRWEPKTVEYLIRQ